jgi:membrane fusion protein, multidrug efflux system
MKKKLLYSGISIVIIGTTIAVSVALINAKPLPRKDNQKHNTMYVKAEKVKLKETKSNMTYRGRVTAFENISLAAEVQGKIMQGDVYFKAGESFKKGDILLKIYSKDIEASIKSGKSSLLQTLSKILPDLKVDYSAEYEKWNTFFNAIETEGLLPELPKISSSKEKVFLAANNVLTAYYNLQQQEINLSRHTIKAPFNGSFKSVNKEIGAIASPGSELATIIRSDKLEVTVPVFPGDLKWIKEGDKVMVSDKNENQKTAIISRISGFVDETTQSVNVYLTYNASGGTGFLHGEYVDVEFKGTKLNVFTIPREALVDEHYVYELAGDKLKKLSVDIVRSLDDSHIISGIDTNKIIVTESLASINPEIEYLAR